MLLSDVDIPVSVITVDPLLVMPVEVYVSVVDSVSVTCVDGAAVVGSCVSQCSPVNPGAHLQMYNSPLSKQVAPFLQGLGEQRVDCLLQISPCQPG